MKQLYLASIAAVGLLFGGISITPAQAADFGGDCCADLEERIAELEATTARKGNRKVSLTITGFVAQQVLFWDDGEESNAYVQGLGLTIGGSQVNFVGSAQINSDWSAGYVLHIETNDSDPLLVTNQDNDDAVIAALFIVESKWYIQSKTYGKLSVGKMNQASDNTALLPDGSGTLLQSNWVVYEGAGYFTSINGVRNGTQWADIAHCATVGLGIGGDCNGAPTNGVRYDTPTFGGFSASAGWGEDDYWDVALRYAGNWSGFAVSVAGSYTVNTDEGGIANVAGGLDAQDVSYFQVGGYVEHVQSGLFVYGAYGTEQIDTAYTDPAADGLGGEVNPADDNPDHFMIKAGIKTKLNALGSTVFWGEYSQYNDQLNPLLLDQRNSNAASSELNRWGIGAMQNIDAASMQLWIHYRKLDGEFTINGVESDLDDIDFVSVGGLIAF